MMKEKTVIEGNNIELEIDTPKIKVGIIENVEVNKNCFINKIYVNTDYLCRNNDNCKSDSVLVYPKLITQVGLDGLNTEKYIYIVKYYITGKKFKAKDNKTHDCFDKSSPICILGKIEKNNCKSVNIICEQNEELFKYTVAVEKNGSTSIEWDLDNKEIEINEKGVGKLEEAESYGLISCLRGGEVVISNSYPHSNLDDKFDTKGNVQFMPSNISTKNAIEMSSFEPDGKKRFLETNYKIYIVKYYKFNDGNNAYVYLLGELPKIKCNYIEIKRNNGKYFIDMTVVKDANVEWYSDKIIKTIDDNNRISPMEVLKDNALKGISLYYLPDEYIEKLLNCAEQLLFPESYKYIKLNELQKNLLITNYAGNLKANLNDDGKIKDKVMEDYENTSIYGNYFHKENKEDKNTIIRQILNICKKSECRYADYRGVIERAFYCKNELLPHLYLISFFASSDSNKRECIVDYCKKIKNLGEQYNYERLDIENRMYFLTEFIKVVNIHFNDILREKITIIASTYIENSCIAALKDIIEMIDPEKSKEVSKAVGMIYGDSEETNIKGLLTNKSLEGENSFNKELLQKIIALLWVEKIGNITLPYNLLKMLAELCVYDDYTSIDEVLRYGEVSNVSREDMQYQLVRSFKTICNGIEENYIMYALASYISNIICDKENIFSDELEYIEVEKWRNGDNKRYFTNIKRHNETKWIMLTEDLAKEWYNVYKLEKEIQDDFCKYLGTFFKDGLAYDVKNLCDNYAYRQLLEVSDKFKNIEYRTKALCGLYEFSTAIDELSDKDGIEIDVCEKMKVMVITENFKRYGLTDKAFLIFKDKEIRKDNIKILFRSWKNNNERDKINALIALYFKEEAYLRAIYLYYSYGKECQKGYTRLYLELQKELEKKCEYLAVCKNKYDVIQLSFEVLSYESIKEFLEWVAACPSDKAGQAIYNPFEVNLKDIVIAYKDNHDTENKWNEFKSYLDKQRNLKTNLWLIVICKIFLFESGYGNVADIGESIRDFIYIEDAFKPRERIPYNFLAIVLYYIKISDDRNICREITNFLSIKRNVIRIVNDNPWSYDYENILNEFKKYAICRYNENESIYYEMLALLDYDLDVNDMKIVASKNGNKEHLIRQMSKKFISNSENERDMREVFANVSWGKMTLKDELGKALVDSIYKSSDNLMEEEKILFKKEEDVKYYQKGCAKILSTYPDKEGLFKYDRENQDDVLKLVVYSSVFSVMYDESIYYRLNLSWKDICYDPQKKYAYLKYLKHVHYAQLDENKDFGDMYKKWRYFKLYLIASLGQSKDEEFENEIINKMSYYHHKEKFWDDYDVFVKTVNDFRSTTINESFKNELLFSLISGDLDDILNNNENIEVINGMSDAVKEKTKKVIYQLDYRKVNLMIFEKYFKMEDKSELITVAKALSYHAADIIENIDGIGRSDFKRKIKESMLEEKPTLVVNNMLELKNIHEEDYKLIFSIMCSRQFIFKIYNKFRYLTIINKSIESKFHDNFFVYLKGCGDNGSEAVSSYLKALNFCMKEMRGELKAFIEDNDICNGIPTEWGEEAKRILDYAKDGKKFVPDYSIKDSSVVKTDNIEFRFVEKILYEKFKEENYKVLDLEEFKSKFSSYCSEKKQKPEEHLENGISLLRAYPEIDESKLDKDNVLSKMELTFQIGLEALEVSSDHLTLREKMEILNELYNVNGRVDMKAVSQTEWKQILNTIMVSVSEKFSFKIWAEYSELIFMILGNEIEERDKEILTEYKAKKTIEERFLFLKEKKDVGFITNNSYSERIYMVLKEEFARIQDDIILSIKILNNVSTDGYVYFEIKNIGKRKAIIDNVGLKVLCRYTNNKSIIGKDDINISAVSELQSGYVTGGRVEVDLNSEEEKNVTLSIENNNKEVVSSYEETIKYSCEKVILEELELYNVDSAINGDFESNLLGRQDKCEEIKKAIDDKNGLMVIYGPSRIGKTSIMNWIRKKMANNYAESYEKKIITVLLGGEGGLGDTSDYNAKFDEKTSDNKNTKYLLVELIKSALENNDRREIKNDILSENDDTLIKNIICKLSKNDNNIENIYSDINEFLKEKNAELWILMDEFQQVIEAWPDMKESAFANICGKLTQGVLLNSIKIILCGSDELVKHMEFAPKSSWRDILNSAHRCSVGKLDYDDFKSMIEGKFNNIKFHENAIHALYDYTGGVALYGKTVCNVIIDDINKNKDKYKNRNSLYVSDVANVTQKLIEQDSEIAEGSRKIIVKLYDAVTKNLKVESDMQYLWYMTEWLESHDSIKEDDFKKGGKLKNPDELYNLLDIAVARGIIKKDEESCYKFTSIFYYYASLRNKGTINIFEEKEERRDLIENICDDINSLGELNREQVYRIAGIISEKSTDKNALKVAAGVTIKVDGNYFQNSGSMYNIGVQNNVQVNIEKLHKTFNTILVSRDKEEIQGCINELPTLKMYLNNYGESVDDTITEDNPKREEVLKEVVSDTFSAASKIGGFSDVSDDKIIELLKIDSEKLKKLKASKYYTQLIFVFALHNLFCKIYEKQSDTELDFCPVAIMYCKVVESILKKEHTLLYVTKLGEKTVKQNGDKFKDIEISKASENKALTIGSYVFHIVYLENGDKLFDKETIKKDWPDDLIFDFSDNIKKLIEEGENEEEWRTHAKLLKLVEQIRNRVAHNLKPINKDIFDKLVSILFEKGEMLRMLDLVKKDN